MVILVFWMPRRVAAKPMHYYWYPFGWILYNQQEKEPRMKYRACKLFGFVLFVCSQEKSKICRRTHWWFWLVLDCWNSNGRHKLKCSKKTKENPPNILIRTPESIPVIMCNPGYINFFKPIKSAPAAEWHEQMGSKRGVQMELALSRLRGVSRTWNSW